MDELTQQIVDDTLSLEPSIRERIIAQLPESWSKEEINNFIETYYGRIPERIVEGDDEEDTDPISEIEAVVEEVDERTLPISTQSRKGLTLDSYIILDGRSVPLRAIYDAGMLEPVRTIVTEGSRRFPVKRVLYAARILDRPRVLVITEETYQVLSNRYPKTTPHDEPLPPVAVKAIQATTTVMQPDILERKLPS